MVTKRIFNVIERIGLPEMPEHPKIKIQQGGLDSLMLAMLIIELENEFNVKIPVIPLVKEHFESVESIENHLKELGVK